MDPFWLGVGVGVSVVPLVVVLALIFFVCCWGRR
jgi:hypothetical protein